MRRRVSWVGSLLSITVVVLLAPFWILWCPWASSWRAHAYRSLMYDCLTQQVALDDRSSEELIEHLMQYVQTHIWSSPADVPYEGKPLRYLVRGVGWCDYMAKVLMRLLAMRGMPARYAMLQDASGISPHTVAEVFYDGRWGVVDVLFGIRFVDAHGDPLTLEALSASPELLEAQPTMAWLRQHRPVQAAHIQMLYTRFLPLPQPPRRSHSGTKRLTVFDRLLLHYARWGGPRFVAWYQDRYLAASGVARPSTPSEHLRLARHWHLAGRADLAKAAYTSCLKEFSARAVQSEARFWLGLLQWELEGNARGAHATFEALLAENPDSRWGPMARYYKGRGEKALGQLDHALVSYRRAVEGGVLSVGEWVAELHHT